MHKFHQVFRVCLVVVLIACMPAVVMAAPIPAISPEAESSLAKIMSDAKVKQGLEFIKNDHAGTITDQKAITAIPAQS